MRENILITPEILEKAGFEYLETESELCREYQEKTLGIEDYREYRLWTKSLKLDIDNGFNNLGTEWHLHVDNDSCDTIGSACISYTWQFNALMEIFGDPLRL